MLDGKKTLIVNGLVLLGSVASAFGLNIGLDTGTASTIAVGILSVLNIILRFVTKGPVKIGA